MIVRYHDEVIKWKHFPRYWPFVRGIHKGQWHRVLMFSLICTQINSWVNNGEAGDLSHHRAHYDVTVMIGLYRYSDITMSAMASNNWNLNCLPNRLFRRISMKTSKLHITGYFEGNPLVTGGFPSQRASNVENVSIKWRYHDTRPLAKKKLSYKTMID